MTQRVSIGVAGWSYPDWQGIVYPAGLKDPLGYLCRYVDCIEINSTFYRQPEEKSCRGWLQRTQTKPDFFFTAKLHRDFSHEGRIEPDMVRQFHRGLAPLLEAGKLRHLLIQFRYDFDDRDGHRDHLQKLAEQFGGQFSIVVEVRHRSWEKADALNFLKDLGVIVANIDYPVGRDSFNLQTCAVGTTGYFRLHGRNAEKWFSKSTRDETYDYYYSTQELAEIQDRIRKLMALYPSVVVITNNHYRGSEVANALELKAALTGRKVLVPEDLMLRYPQLEKIALNRPLF
ncbi:MAG TPA: DUF72 domain-containing protein [Anaerohalosphaeraceae bacterium]|nr:DUF72 domain-containing protein [Phycisphaerae bacterium]HOL32242.1 DUF72 domain-containing protein [Anaerohalosphaeraceae bacterium]HOM76406.1 DUF72 domain-containing protein [Anaerohalosphaeraceae bacterium]HPC63672.1 DUF72 domain-containing protein [Anaerohalosphaeraceae bacterium]HPO69393.1 DUF72 domain-containing protein [Anaerohalosphaeraceae bacterium]